MDGKLLDKNIGAGERFRLNQPNRILAEGRSGEFDITWEMLGDEEPDQTPIRYQRSGIEGGRFWLN